MDIDERNGRALPFPVLLHPEPAQFLALGRYEVARRAVAEARAVDDIVEVLGRNAAVHAYARQAKDRQMEIDAVEIRIRAERRLGELMAAQKATIGVAKGGGDRRSDHRGKRNPGDPATLAEAGIDKYLAKRARTLAAVPEETFEKLMTDKRRSKNRRVALDPDAKASAHDLKAKRYGRIAEASAARARAEALAVENAKLIAQVEALGRRVAAFIEAYDALEESEALWKRRALDLGWSEPRA